VTGNNACIFYRYHRGRDRYGRFSWLSFNQQ
jgi:hypothetical protein